MNSVKGYQILSAVRELTNELWPLVKVCVLDKKAGETGAGILDAIRALQATIDPLAAAMHDHDLIKNMPKWLCVDCCAEQEVDTCDHCRGPITGGGPTD